MLHRGNITITGLEDINRHPTVSVKLENGNVWLTKHELARLFGVFIQTIDANMRSIFKSRILNECILSLELRINLLCRLPFFLAFRFQVSYLLRKAFSVLTGNYRRFFNRSSHKSLYVVNYILFSIIEMKSCNFFPT